jgi:chemotaxis signal transduction protein
MSALPLDDFAREMLNHFLDSTSETLANLSVDADFPLRFPQLCADWQAEAQANQLGFFANALIAVSNQVQNAAPSPAQRGEICEKLSAYLRSLKDQPDSELLCAQYALALPVEVEEVQKFLQCRRGEYRFLLPVNSVVEISQWKAISPLPQPDLRVQGMIAFRGQATPVFKLDAPVEGKTFFVICEKDGAFFAIEVNATDDMYDVKNSEFQYSSEGTQTRFIARDELILSVLNLETLVAP